jgi:hypothetical protein
VPRQKEQLEAFTALPLLSESDVEAITAAGKGKFYRHFMGAVWNAAKP